MLELIQVSTSMVSAYKISINLDKTFLRISRIRNIPLTWILARVFVYVPPLISFPRFWTWPIERFCFLFWSILNGVTLKTSNIFQRPFLRSLFLEGLIFGGAYLRREICVSKSIWLALQFLIVGRKFTVFALFYFVIEENYLGNWGNFTVLK